MKNEVKEGSDNVFADLGLPDPEGDLVKAKLVSRIHTLITERGLTQKEAAKILGIDQPKVSALLRGRFGGYSAERLLRFLNELGQEVSIVVRPGRQIGKRGSLRVVVQARLPRKRAQAG